jgi:hypothetical protein
MTLTKDELTQRWQQHLGFADDDDWNDKPWDEWLKKALGDGVFPTVQEYIDAGVSPEQYQSWYAVYGWDIERMKELEAAGVDIDECWKPVKVFGYENSIAYAYCNNDIDIERVKELIA